MAGGITDNRIEMDGFAGAVNVAVAIHKCLETRRIVARTLHLKPRRFDLRIGQRQEIKIVACRGRNECDGKTGGLLVHFLEAGKPFAIRFERHHRLVVAAYERHIDPLQILGSANRFCPDKYFGSRLSGHQSNVRHRHQLTGVHVGFVGGANRNQINPAQGPGSFPIGHGNTGLLRHGHVEGRNAPHCGQISRFDGLVNQNAAVLILFVGVVVIATCGRIIPLAVLTIFLVTAIFEVMQDIIFVQLRDFNRHFLHIHDVQPHVSRPFRGEIQGVFAGKLNACGHLAKKQIAADGFGQLGIQYAPNLVGKGQYVGVGFVEIAPDNEAVFGQFGGGFHGGLNGIELANLLWLQFLRSDDTGVAFVFLETRLHINNFDCVFIGQRPHLFNCLAAGVGRVGYFYPLVDFERDRLGVFWRGRVGQR